MKYGHFAMLLAFLILLAPIIQSADILIPHSVVRDEADDDPVVHYNGFYSGRSPRNILNLERDNPWALPKLSGTDADAVDTIRVAAFRIDFQIDNEDSTTGNGKFDYRDTSVFQAEEGHIFDWSPHDKRYFSKHMRALRNYWNYVSGGKIEIVWEVFPGGDRESYSLPYEMRHYGEPSPHIGLTNYFLDCFLMLDTIDQSIDFSEFDSYFLFHAGSDRQNDIFPDEFPPGGDTPFDLFTGYIFLIDTVLGLDKVYDSACVDTTIDTTLFSVDTTFNVDSTMFFVDTTIEVDSLYNYCVIDSTEVMDALIMPETASQDNRGTTLNAVIAHEFGHQLGLVDLYRTDNFFSKIGDFALMDNNGFGAGVDFGQYSNVGNIFGVFPVYPMAWSRAYLGFEEPVVYRQGTSIQVAAAELYANNNTIAKIPITEHEYYLIENRQIDIDGKGDPAAWLDSISNVVLGPIEAQTIKPFDTTLTGEYDFLLPGHGMLIWKIDEMAAILDYNGNGRTNFEDNQLQWDQDRLFIKLIEADGLVNFGGEYYSGNGRQEDMFYNPNNVSMTPNSNPSSAGHGGTNTHIYITNISNSQLNMTFDVEIGMLSDGFPQRTSFPIYGLAPIADDIDGDGSAEIIAAAGNNLICVEQNGDDFTPLGPDYIDSLDLVKEIIDYKGPSGHYVLPLFARTDQFITAGPVTGDFGLGGDKFVAVGAGPTLYVYKAEDVDEDGLADTLFTPVEVGLGLDIVWMSFGEELVVATMDTLNTRILLTRYDQTGLIGVPVSPTGAGRIEEPELFGACRVNDHYALIAGDSTEINLYYVTGTSADDVHDFPLNGYFNYGPVAVDLNRDSLYEIAVATGDGHLKAITIDTELNDTLVLYDEIFIDDDILANPSVADLDNDGYPEILLGGTNRVYAFDKDFVSLIDFPKTIDRKYPTDFAISTPIVGDINGDGSKDIIVYSSTGSCYALNAQGSLNDEIVYGFPISAGDLGIGTPLLFPKQNGGGLGIVGQDGWFYSYDVSYNEATMDWPMGGGNPNATYALKNADLAEVKAAEARIPEGKFFGYPNPSLDGQVNFYYELGDNAEVKLTIFDMSGRLVFEDDLPGTGNRFDETKNLSHLPTGVYRCILEADFTNGGTESAFTDVAIIK